METTTKNTEIELEALEQTRSELRQRLVQIDAVEREHLAAQSRERQEIELARRRELEQQRQAAIEDYYRAREAANSVLAEPLAAMHEAEQRWIKLVKELRGVGRYVPALDYIPPRELKPFGDAVDVAYGLQRQLKEREQEKVSQRLIKEQEDRRLAALRREREREDEDAA